MSSPSTRIVRTVDIPLGPGRTFRVGLSERESGEPEELTLMLGFGGADTGDPFHRGLAGSPPLVLPGEALTEVRDAVDALARKER